MGRRAAFREGAHGAAGVAWLPRGALAWWPPGRVVRGGGGRPVGCCGVATMRMPDFLFLSFSRTPREMSVVRRSRTESPAGGAVTLRGHRFCAENRRIGDLGNLGD